MVMTFEEIVKAEYERREYERLDDRYKERFENARDELIEMGVPKEEIAQDGKFAVVLGVRLECIGSRGFLYADVGGRIRDLADIYEIKLSLENERRNSLEWNSKRMANALEKIAGQLEVHHEDETYSIADILAGVVAELSEIKKGGDA